MCSKNRLPNYFFGVEMNQDEHSDKNTSNYFEDIHLSEPNLSRIPSPASSLASTKKLEWDSGADIGYIYDSVKHSRKSKSFPSLNMDTSSKSHVQKLNDALELKTEDEQFQKKKKSKSFKHSTPYDNNRIIRSSGNSASINKDECLQTTLIKKSSKEVQTDLVFNEKQIEDKSLQTDHAELLLVQSISSSSGGSSSKSGSFKYIPGSKFRYNDDKAQSSNNSVKTSSNSTSSPKNGTDSGSCSPLGQMISTQYSKHLIDDIDKSLAILNKFIKSKNYSNDTKKHYAKKIVNKIIKNKYSDDTEDTTTNSSIVGDDKIESNCQLVNDKVYVECGIQCDEINKKSQVISDTNNCNIKESLKKLNEIQLDLKNWKQAQTLSEKLFEARKTHKTRSKKISSSDHSSSISIEGDSKRDYLLQHSKNERKRQLSWINNEISYLQKLKDLLQIKDVSTSNTNSSSDKLNSIIDKVGDHSASTDIEAKFNKEFGLHPVSISAKNTEIRDQTLHQLSKFLTYEQIKTIIAQDANKIDSNKIEPEVSVPEIKNGRNITSYNTSYNSHKTSIYKEKSFPCSTHTHIATKTKQTSSSDLNNKILSVGKDASIQCSLNKTESVKSSSNDNEHQRRCCKNKEKSSSEYISTSELESLVVEDKKEKENHLNAQKQKQKQQNVLTKGSMAYFLRFEEDSQSEIENFNKNNNQLEQVTVKIPRTRSHSKLKRDEDTNTSHYTLQEYLLKNRPNFVRAADWRRTQFIYELQQQQPRNIFTCQEMKEQTWKKYKKLPEVQEKVKSNILQVEKRHNRCMANVFSKKLQKKTLQGHICIATCANVMTS